MRDVLQAATSFITGVDTAAMLLNFKGKSKVGVLLNFVGDLKTESNVQERANDLQNVCFRDFTDCWNQ